MKEKVAERGLPGPTVTFCVNVVFLQGGAGHEAGSD